MPGQRRHRRFGHFVDVGRRFVAIVFAAEFNRALRRLRKSHPRAGALAEDALIRDLVILGFAAQALRGDLLELLPGIHRHRMGGAGHRVRRLAAAGHARERKMLRRVAPHDVALFPGDAENLRAGAMDIDHRFGSQISDSGLEAHPAIGRDDEQPVEADGAADVAAQRYADAAHFGADPFGAARHPLLPVELLRAALQRFLEKCAGRVLKLALHRRPVLRFAFRTVDVADRHLVQPRAFARLSR